MQGNAARISLIVATASVLAACVQQPAPRAVPITLQAPARESAAPAPKTRPTHKTPNTNVSAAQFIGKDTKLARAKLGAPTLISREGGAALMLYKFDRCAAHILSVTTSRGEKIRSIHVRDIKTGTLYAADTHIADGCLSAIAKHNMAG